jgi:nucleoside-diphosphate-sugar epimerase
MIFSEIMSGLIEMRVAVSSPDEFVAPYLFDALGDALVEIPPEVLEEGQEMMLDALLMPCTTLIHFNASAPESDRDDRSSLLAMREAAKPILGAVKRHQGLHLILVGSLRVHPQATPDEPFYSGFTRLAPRDVAAEGQLWVEESALEHAEPERPVSIIRASNVQGPLKSGGDGHGLLHAFARDSIFGWVSVPGNGGQVKDFLHVRDLVESILGVMHSPPPTREAIAIGTGRAVPLRDVAALFSSETGAEPQFGHDDSREVWGVVDVREVEDRLGFRPSISLEQMVSEAIQTIN